jgi:hypothetical protein
MGRCSIVNKLLNSVSPYVHLHLPTTATMASSRPTTPVPDDCPVCLDPLPSGYACVSWCLHHPLCRVCADRIYSGGDHRCPLCRQPWFPLRNAPPAPSTLRALQHLMPAVRTTLTISHPDTWIPLPRCSHGTHGFCGFCFSERETPFDDMNWAPEGGYNDGPQGAGLSDDDYQSDDDMDWTPLSPHGSPTTSSPRHHLYSSS